MSAGPATRALVLERAATVTPGRLKKFAQRTATRVGKVSFEDRHERPGKAGVCGSHPGRRHVRTVPVLSTVLAAPIWDRLTQQTKAISHTPPAAASTSRR